MAQQSNEAKASRAELERLRKELQAKDRKKKDLDELVLKLQTQITEIAKQKSQVSED